MTSVGASTHSHIHDGIVPGRVSNADGGMPVPDRWNADFRFQQMLGPFRFSEFKSPVSLSFGCV
jgi:hypothetical protein